MRRRRRGLLAGGNMRHLLPAFLGTAAVLAFKKKRKIINRAYAQQGDDIVGKMTIKALDDDMAIAENSAEDLPESQFCIEKL